MVWLIDKHENAKSFTLPPDIQNGGMTWLGAWVGSTGRFFLNATLHIFGTKNMYGVPPHIITRRRPVFRGHHSR